MFYNKHQSNPLLLVQKYYLEYVVGIPYISIAENHFKFIDYSSLLNVISLLKDKYSYILEMIHN